MLNDSNNVNITKNLQVTKYFAIEWCGIFICSVGQWVQARKMESVICNNNNPIIFQNKWYHKFLGIIVSYKK